MKIAATPSRAGRLVPIIVWMLVDRDVMAVPMAVVMVSISISFLLGNYERKRLRARRKAPLIPKASKPRNIASRNPTGTAPKKEEAHSRNPSTW